MKPLKPISQLKRKPRTLVELFKSPRRWCKRAYAKTPEGISCLSFHDDSASFCLIGGCNKLGIKTDIVFDKLQKLFGIYNVSIWNDNQNLTHAGFLETLRKAGV